MKGQKEKLAKGLRVKRVKGKKGKLAKGLRVKRVKGKKGKLAKGLRVQRVRQTTETNEDMNKPKEPIRATFASPRPAPPFPLSPRSGKEPAFSPNAKFRSAAAD